jgi:putative flippase GtrA
MPDPPARTRAIQWLTQASRFGVVGVIGAGLDYLALTQAVAHGASPYAARPFTLVIAVVVTWWLNRSLTFAAKTPPSWREFGHYAAITTTGLAIQLAVYWGGLALGAPIWLAFLTGIASSVVFSFLRVRQMFSKR